MHALIERLVRIAGAAGALTDPSDVDAYATDCNPATSAELMRQGPART